MKVLDDISRIDLWYGVGGISAIPLEGVRIPNRNTNLSKIISSLNKFSLTSKALSVYDIKNYKTLKDSLRKSNPDLENTQIPSFILQAYLGVYERARVVVDGRAYHLLGFENLEYKGILKEKLGGKRTLDLDSLVKDKDYCSKYIFFLFEKGKYDCYVSILKESHKRGGLALLSQFGRLKLVMVDRLVGISQSQGVSV